MEFASKLFLGGFSLIGSCFALGSYPFLSFSGSRKLGGGDSQVINEEIVKCRKLEEIITSSISYLIGIDTSPGFGNSNCNKADLDSSGQIKVVLRREKNSTRNVKGENGKDFKRGILSLVQIAIEKTVSSQGNSTWGNWQSEWSSSLQHSGESKKSFVITGSSNDGEYLMWIAGLKDIGNNSEGRVLVAKKEISTNEENAISVKFGLSEWKQTGNSSQIQIKKEDLKDWLLTAKFMKLGT